MDELFSLLYAYRTIVGAALITVLLVIVIFHWWDEVKLFFKSMMYGLPLIGKTRRLSKDLAVRKDGWFAAERTLCDDFSGDIRRIAADPDMYDRAKSYLGKVQELGRNELGILMRLMLLAMVVVEALGFAYVLAGNTSPGASEKLEVQYAIGIAFLISIVLVFLTHHTGQELHKRSLISKVRTWSWHDRNENRRNLIGDMNKVSLEHDQVDDAEPAYLHILHRIDHNGKATPGFPIWTVITLIAIIGVATTATYIRYETYIKEKTSETIGASPTPNSIFSLGNLESNDLPDALTAPQDEALSKAKSEQESAQDAASLTTYGVLAAVFVLIQIMGIGIGYKTGFAGKESLAARRIIRNFPSRTSYEAWYERKRDAIARVAQKHLSNLQVRLTKNAAATGVDKAHREVLQHSADRTFIDHHEQAEIRAERSRLESEKRKAARTVEAKQDMPESLSNTTELTQTDTTDTPAAQETEEERSARILREVLAEKAAKEQEKQVETDEEMRARLRKENGLDA
ncbi:hypothetical protein [Thalassospira profundimaris]|uniref:hypothetical protein n=1 Tax=Thalassospira profundimaris TaxID=502049 RepID=UPI0002873E39|nr:hypothetical protein [Thalassospira profundimaris]EKF09834.1 hypothetical protein TH2_00670 [Thalassospira profundimaris WP0211]